MMTSQLGRARRRSTPMEDVSALDAAIDALLAETNGFEEASSLPGIDERHLLPATFTSSHFTHDPHPAPIRDPPTFNALVWTASRRSGGGPIPKASPRSTCFTQGPPELLSPKSAWEAPPPLPLARRRDSLGATRVSEASFIDGSARSPVGRSRRDSLGAAAKAPSSSSSPTPTPRARKRASMPNLSSSALSATLAAVAMPANSISRADAPSPIKVPRSPIFGRSTSALLGRSSTPTSPRMEKEKVAGKVKKSKKKLDLDFGCAGELPVDEEEEPIRDWSRPPPVPARRTYDPHAYYTDRYSVASSSDSIPSLTHTHSRGTSASSEFSTVASSLYSSLPPSPTPSTGSDRGHIVTHSLVSKGPLVPHASRVPLTPRMREKTRKQDESLAIDALNGYFQSKAAARLSNVPEVPSNRSSRALEEEQNALAKELVGQAMVGLGFNESAPKRPTATTAARDRESIEVEYLSSDSRAAGSTYYPEYAGGNADLPHILPHIFINDRDGMLERRSSNGSSRSTGSSTIQAHSPAPSDVGRTLDELSEYFNVRLLSESSKRASLPPPRVPSKDNLRESAAAPIVVVQAPTPTKERKAPVKAAATRPARVTYGWI